MKTKKYCENCEIELSGDVIKLERNDGIVFDFAAKSVKINL